MRILPVLLLTLITMEGIAQKTVTFPSLDGLPVTADLYLQDKDFPYIILFHQANSSRGEYKETALRLLKLGYNCLAVDLRSGKEMNYIQNETVIRAIEKRLPTYYLDAEQDILAAIQYAKTLSNKQIVIFGSSYSASLVLKVGNHNKDVMAVIAFSPGEYFQSRLILKDQLQDFDKQAFVAATRNEEPFVKELVSYIPKDSLSFFTPAQGSGVHGSKALWSNQPGNEEVWVALLLFFKNLKEN